MDRLRTLELFVRICDRGSFTAAATDLGMSRPVATAAIAALERRLGVRLLARSTRHVAPTAEGDAYRARAAAILADLEAADGAAGGAVSGTIRIDVAGHVARTILLPALPGFLARHPALTVHLGDGERFVDLIREGVDCVVRAGVLPDSDLVARPLGTLDEITVASPAYLARHGTPTIPGRLAADGHRMVGFVSSLTRLPIPLEFIVDGARLDVTLPASLLVNTADTAAEAARLGLGLIQAPRYRFDAALAAGELVALFPDHPPPPTPIAIVFPRRELAPRVRVVADWLADTLKPTLAGGAH